MNGFETGVLHAAEWFVVLFPLLFNVRKTSDEASMFGPKWVAIYGLVTALKKVHIPIEWLTNQQP
jgi:hypothetical protein